MTRAAPSRLVRARVRLVGLERRSHGQVLERRPIPGEARRPRRGVGRVSRQPNFEGLLCQFVLKTGEHTYCSCGVWESMEALVDARPQMIAFLDTIRGLLEEISPELGVTDPVSGTVVYEEGLGC